MGSEINGENTEDDMEMEEKRQGTARTLLLYIVKLTRQRSEMIRLIVFEDFSAVLYSADSSTFAAGRGGLSAFNRSEENSVSSSTDDTHSSLNTEEEEEELAYGIIFGL